MFWFSEGSISLWWRHLCRPCCMNIVHMLLVVQVSRIEDSWYWDEDFAMLSGFAFLWKLVIFAPWMHGIVFEGFFSSLWVLLVYGWGFFLWIKPWIICRQICLLKNSQGNHAFCCCKNGILVSYTIVAKQLRLYRLGIEIQPSQFSSVYFITCQTRMASNDHGVAHHHLHKDIISGSFVATAGIFCKFMSQFFMLATLVLYKQILIFCCLL